VQLADEVPGDVLDGGMLEVILLAKDKAGNEGVQSP
jgi:hypothetical protein